MKRLKSRLARSVLLGLAISGALAVVACEKHNTKEIRPAKSSQRVTLETIWTTYPSPDDWHRLAVYGNWDFVDPSVWRAVAMRADCDRATALVIFWKSQPEYFAQFAGAAMIPAVNRESYELITLIRKRWQDGGYTRAEIAFDPALDVWPLDLADLRKRYGKQVDKLMPQSMRTKLKGRRLDDAGFRAPGVF